MSFITAPGIAPAIIADDLATFNGQVNVTLASAKPLCYAFELQVPVVILGGKWYMGVTVTGTTNMGVYTLAGNLVAGSDSGAITNLASQIMTYTYGTALYLAPGRYFLALGCSNGTDTYLAKGVSAVTPSHRGRLAANSIAAGALPLTTGALSNTGNFPACSLTVQGGL